MISTNWLGQFSTWCFKQRLWSFLVQRSVGTNRAVPHQAVSGIALCDCLRAFGVHQSQWMNCITRVKNWALWTTYKIRTKWMMKILTTSWKNNTTPSKNRSARKLGQWYWIAPAGGIAVFSKCSLNQGRKKIKKKIEYLYLICLFIRLLFNSLVS